MSGENRCALARKNAGLSVAQAAKLLGVEPRVVDDFEAADVDDIYEEGITFAGRMAELYRVSTEWMLGQVERRDYATVDGMKGAGKLTPSDRDTIAEFAASLPRGNAPAVRAKLEGEHWLTKIENLKAGDACEFRYPARSEWLPGVVVVNGGSGYWSVRDESDAEGKRGQVATSIYIEHVRLPGQTEAWPR